MANGGFRQAGNVLLGLSAGLQGQGAQFAESQQQQEERRRQQELERRKTVFTDSKAALNFAKQGRFDLITQLGQNRLEASQQFPDADFSDTQQLLQLSQLAQQGNPEAAQNLINTLENNVQIGTGLGVLTGPTQQDRLAKLRADKIERELSGAGGESTGGAEQQFFESLISGLPENEQKKAINIKLGLKGRAVSNAVLSAIASGDIDSLTDAKAQIKQAEKFAELTGASRAKAIDAGVDRIVKIDAGIKNIDRAVEAVRGGAGVGAIEKNFPSLKAASIELDNIQKSMALDVIGAVTFGALSKGELDLAKDVALPTGLDSNQLIQHLQDRKAAQEKLRGYFNEQIQFLDQGGTVAGFLRQKERGVGAQTSQQAQAQGAPAGGGAQQDLSQLSDEQLIQLRQQQAP